MRYHGDDESQNIIPIIFTSRIAIFEVMKRNKQ
jgi:hypothetical protein